MNEPFKPRNIWPDQLGPDFKRPGYFTREEIAELLEQAQKLNLTLYPENTLNDIKFMVEQELRKFTSKPEQY